MIINVIATNNAKVTTVEKVKSFLQISDSSQDTFISTLIDMVTASFEAYTGRSFSVRTIEEKLPGTGTAKLVLSSYPVTSIASIYDNGDLLDATEYELSDASGTIYKKKGVFYFSGTRELFTGIEDHNEAENNFKVTYISGSVIIPLDIEAAAIEAVKTMYLNRDSDSTVASESVSGVYSATYSTTNATVTSVLERYRNYAF